MFEWTDTQKTIREMFRTYVEREIAPAIDDMEDGKLLPYDHMRSMMKALGLRDQIEGRFRKRRAAMDAGKTVEAEKPPTNEPSEADLTEAAVSQLLFIELSRISPAFAMSFGASIGLAGLAVMGKGTPEQTERWGIPLLTLDKIGSWCLTEPGAGSDAFGSMRTRATVDGDRFVLNGSKTFITNAPYADIFVVYAKIENGEEAGMIRSFVVEREDAGLATGEPFKKMGMHTSPTGEVFLDDCRIPTDRLLGGPKGVSRNHVKESLQGERSGMPAMALGIIERCLEDTLKYVQEREQFGQPIANFQLVQAKIARMYVHYENVRNLVFKQIWSSAARKGSMRDACACKIYTSEAATEVAMDAVQIHGGFGYMREGEVERFARDAKLLEIGAGTTEIQLLTVAREVLSKGIE